MDDLDTFLAAHPPFDALSGAERRVVCEAMKEHAFAAGESILVEDGPPAAGWQVIIRGAVELVHDGEVIDRLGPGECFGHTSLLTGLAPTFTVQALEPTVCGRMTLEQALIILGRPAGVRYIALQDRERLTRSGHTAGGLPAIRTARAGALVLRPPRFCEPDMPIRDAARTLSDRPETALLVRLPAGLGIVTDAILRERVVAGEVPVDAPVARVARAPVPSVSEDELAIDATSDMLDSGIDHLLVTAVGGRPLGLISASDLAGLDTHSPFALRHAILNAPDEEALVAAALQTRSVFKWLFDAGLSAATLSRVLTLQSDAITDRLLTQSITRHGPAPVQWAWLVLGSGARREFTLASDQDNALAYGDGPEGADVDPYFARLGAEVNDGLRRCGFDSDTNGVLAGNRQWRMSRAAWAQTLESCFSLPDHSHLIRATVAFDFRHGSGGLDVAPALVACLRRAADHPGFMSKLARIAEGYKPPLTLRGTITTDGGLVDLKRGGIIPIVNLARFHALSARITVSPTLDRLTAARDTGALEADTADALIEAFGIVRRLRFAHHAQRLDAGLPVDDRIDLGALSPIRRRELREAFRAITRAQRRLAVYVPSGL